MPDFAFHAVREPVLDEDGLYDRKPQPRPFYGTLVRIGGTVVAVPDGFALFGRDALARIGDGEADLFPFRI